MKKKRYTPALLATLIALFAPVGAGAQSVDIVFGKESMTVGEMMLEIERQTDYHFAYNRNVFDVSRNVSTGRRTVSLGEAMDIMTVGQSMKYVIHKNYIAIMPTAVPPRPQVRRQAAPRTSDVYRRSNPDTDVGPVSRNSVPHIFPLPEEVVPLEPTKEFYSDYRPTTLYGDVPGRLPRLALKTNLLYGAATFTPNIAVEYVRLTSSFLRLFT